ncbi:succinate-semialdehyde dehydrogenase / glutarate-semialdehyde dehydrogenase [Bowdeniella nasicola]|uniref:Succinate-semialdehyde dehydrogenase / glutarate-semialdehyde dehydrogenase n=2 Tax=Bowdeniella nasicola TaxID=208480 RepID=A0A1H4DN57_9ACTO|nr:succinate-semialdehyde dehydrogenase / glutarate-semialdehyde dehydrogenase [Bowdeniella nasicola]
MSRTELIDKALAYAPTQLFINGRWQDSGSGATFDVINPATGEVLAAVADATPEDGMAALAAASEAQHDWQRTAPRERAELLRAAFDRVMELKDEFATLMTLEMGKPLAEGYGEVAYGAEFLRWFSEEAVRINGRYTSSPEGNLRVLTLKRPVGPSLFITPWNFPLAMATRKIAPALAAGCATILKPAHLTPLTSLAFVKVCEEVGIPAGVVNVIPASQARPLTGPIIQDRRLRKLSFTGSTPVGMALMKECADNVVRTSMELGGSAPFIVFEDADLDKAVEAAHATKLRNMGEACNAANRFYVHSSIADEFSKRLAKRFKELTVGDGMEEETDIGPIVSDEQRDSIAEMVDKARSEGAEVLTGGEKSDGAGFFYPPTVVTNLKATAELVTDEIFGPVAPIVPFETEDEVVGYCNDSMFGLAGYLHTGSIDRALRLAERLEVGMLGINSGTISNAAAPFGGVKHSGVGREGGFEGIEEYLEVMYLGLEDPFASEK